MSDARWMLVNAVEKEETRIAVVRYDAFGDMGGRLSFSAAIIDDRGDGLVISSIHARGESRTYAKGVVEGDSEVTLSPMPSSPASLFRPQLTTDTAAAARIRKPQVFTTLPRIDQ